MNHQKTANVPLLTHGPQFGTHWPTVSFDPRLNHAPARLGLPHLVTFEPKLIPWSRNNYPWQNRRINSVRNLININPVINDILQLGELFRRNGRAVEKKLILWPLTCAEARPH